MDEQSGQLTSTRINQLAGESAGHTNETAFNEIVCDNPLDEDASEICVIKSDTNKLSLIHISEPTRPY